MTTQLSSNLNYVNYVNYVNNLLWIDLIRILFKDYKS